ncbi:hypothetical protein SAMN04488044_2312 [Cognatishimia maritima]|uniref:Uncharacterized protein n=2 Tax=Cognatishimia maritima TaxID=870908 RepID=A0A1M5RVY9_9RHOB|nr:hypothetical protein SAMN04488044_2312 [Cognatishimia maritima]
MRRLGASCTLIASLCTASPLEAEAQCGPRDIVLDRLAEIYGENRQAIGLARENTLMELFASQESGSWTITVTTAQGLTCLIAAGQNFETAFSNALAHGKDV